MWRWTRGIDFMKRHLLIFLGLACAVFVGAGAVRTTVVVQPAVTPASYFFWDLESDTPNSGAITSGPTYSFGAARSTSQAYSGSYSFHGDPAQTFSIVQLFNDTDVDEWGALAYTNPSGKVSFRWRHAAWLDNGQIFQLSGKSNSGPLDTNDGIALFMDNIGGAVDHGLAFDFSGNNGATTVTLRTLGLDFNTDQWYLIELYFDRNAGIDSTKTLKIVVDGVQYGATSSALASMACVAFHQFNLGSDTAATVDTYLDDFKVEALPSTQRAGFISKGTAADNNTNADLTPTLPIHTTNDILFAQVQADATSTVSTATSGWSQIGSAIVEGGREATWWWKRAASGSETSPTFTGFAGTFTLNFAQVYCYRGAIATGTPFEDATTAQGTDTTPSTAAIDTTGVARAVVCFMVVHDDTAYSVAAPPIGWENSADDTTGTGGDGRLSVITTGKETAGTVSSVSVGTLTGAESWSTLTLALIPD